MREKHCRQEDFFFFFFGLTFIFKTKAIFFARLSHCFQQGRRGHFRVQMFQNLDAFGNLKKILVNLRRGNEKKKKKKNLKIVNRKSRFDIEKKKEKDEEYTTWKIEV